MASINQCRGFLYRLARLLGDASAVRKGRVPRRIERRIAGKVTGRILRRLFKCIIVTWLTLLLASSTFAGEAHRAEDLVPLVVPDGGTVKQEGERLDIYDAKSRHVGYGYTRPDGSVELFNMNGTRRATIRPGPGGRVRVTVPRGKR